MGILGTIFGSNKIMDGIIKGVDAMVYTEEEKKENHKTFLKLYEPFKLGQRCLALTFAPPFALFHFCIYTSRVIMWDNEPYQSAAASIQTEMNQSFGLIVELVVGFYFGGGAAEGIIKSLIKKS